MTNTEQKSTPERRHTFNKPERLRLRTLVENLFSEGNTLYEYPLRLTTRILDSSALEASFPHGVPAGIGKVQALFTVPKKKRRRAVDRVLMRRRIREAYRLNKYILEDAVKDTPELRTIGLAFIYLHSENMEYATIERKMKKLLMKAASAVRPAEEKQEVNL